MSVFLTFTIFLVGILLFLTASTRIIRHDDGSGKVMVQCSSGFVLMIVAATVGWILL